MQYGTIAGKHVSKIVFGCASAQMTNGEDVSPLLDAALEAGINAFDTARMYGKSEDVLGRWLRGKPREELFIITKGCHPTAFGRRRISPRCLRIDLERSLEALGCETIDLYFLHRDDPRIPVGEIVQMLNDVCGGRVRAFGASNWSVARIEEANAYAGAHGLRPFVASEPNFGLAAQVGEPWPGVTATLSGADAPAARAWYRASHMPVLAYSPLGRGMFSGKVRSSDAAAARTLLDRPARRGYLCAANIERLARAEKLAQERGVSVSQVALAWLFAQGIDAYAVLGMSSPARIDAAIGSLSLELTPAEAAWLDLAAER